ncbi:phage tail protein [Hyphobacterium marinum]|uniref:Tail fiber protein n=1 Tax=Hyphobacterium marinum TaxID=3116574 RepID=A0ABU7LYD3_9PROT|nr:tail fiber protein [Hyphobacterium sp. Y6023]MEE2566573.1 tail fiber protein [Hyphobacterium sp. Y6023]
MLRRSLSLAALSASLLCGGTALAQQPPFVGEIMVTAGTYCPRGWAEANGQLLPISQNDALFSLYGTIYGGDGRSTFGLPDLRGRMAMNHGHGNGLSNRMLGQTAGEPDVTLLTSNLASHSHTFNASSVAGTSATPSGSTLGTYPVGTNVYGDANANGPQMNPQVVGETGNNTPVYIQQPSVGARYCVALVGIYPSRP